MLYIPGFVEGNAPSKYDVMGISFYFVGSIIIFYGEKIVILLKNDYLQKKSNKSYFSFILEVNSYIKNNKAPAESVIFAIFSIN